MAQLCLHSQDLPFLGMKHYYYCLTVSGKVLYIKTWQNPHLSVLVQGQLLIMAAHYTK
jgi:hypothetical protein